MWSSTMRTRLAAGLAIVVGAALALGACSAPSAGTSPSAAPTAAPAGAFPVTVTTGYGDITLDKQPERIVSLSFQYADVLTALDVTPVATSISAGIADAAAVEAAFPWLAGAEFGKIDDTLIGADYTAQLEAIAAYKPDLILANTWQVSEELYSRISAIAPTFTGVRLGNNDWDDLTTALGTLTGTSAAAEAAIAEVEGKYATVRADFPELEGLTYYTTRYDANGFGFGNGSWLDGFGMKPGPKQDNTQRSAEQVSLENIDQIDSGFLGIWYWQTEPAEVEAHPGYADLPSVRNGLVYVSDLAFANATNSAGPRSTAWAIDRIVPLFENSTLHQG